HEINNFYTATVYEKGAEIVRMLKALLGEDGFRKGMDLYFSRHDGHAATVEDFIKCFTDANASDFSQFMRWYAQPGTPELKVTGSFDAAAKRFRLDIAQNLPPRPGNPVGEPMVIPLLLGLIGRDGRDLPLATAGGRVERGMVLVSRPAESFTFLDIPERPVLSLNRGFSAPIKVFADTSPEDLQFLAGHDGDPFNRWEALQVLATRLLAEGVAALRSGGFLRVDPALIDALRATLSDPGLEPAFVAQALSMPAETDIAREIGEDVDPDAIFRARSELRRTIGRELGALLEERHAQMTDRGPYSPDAASAGHRALKNTCLDLLAMSG